MDVDDSYILYLDEEDTSSYPQEPINIEDELNQFRLQWQQEICSKQESERDEPTDEVERQMTSRPSDEDEAKYLFLQGTHAEQSGKFTDAILYYRRAVQLVPDIEFKIDELKSYRKERPRVESECSLQESDNGDEFEDLCAHFHKIYLDDQTLCRPELPQSGAHFSDLPVEVLVYIFKWVVSSELDVQSLENLALVSRGFYLSAREEELWKVICQRVWGANCGEATNYNSYRAMYFKRPHLNYHGCYISRCTYFRQGEMILDSFYRPYQMVEYFRYIRFFPDGQMLMLTSPDPPVMIVGKMKSRNCGLQGILFGYYKMNGNQITGILKRRRTDHTPTMFRYRRKNRNNQNEDSIEQTFNLKLELTHSKNRRHSVLMWISYSIHSKYRLSGQENVAEFELKDDTYPALVFSKVKSYTAVASKPLSANIHLRYG